ncbi:MAG TPA: anti-sigma factor [Burkholderiales bacterium]|nr:anti-sigma factor [Burkholderiales bacterium]
MRPERLAEADLHAYVDDQLDAARRTALESWLAAHPDDAARVAAYRVLAERLRAAYAPVLEEPLPEELLSAVQAKPAGRRRFARAALAVAAGTLIALAVSRYFAPAPASDIVQRAAMAHAVYAAEVQHPVEARARAELLDSLSQRLQMRVQAPDLESAGLAFLGGRLLPGDAAAAALLMYEGQNGQRVTLYWGPEFRQARETGLVYASGERGMRVYYWLDDECGYALASAELSQDELHAIAEIAHEQLEK